MLDRMVSYLLKHGTYFGVEEFAQLPIEILQAVDASNEIEHSDSRAYFMRSMLYFL